MNKRFLLFFSLTFANVLFGGIVDDGLKQMSLNDQINMGVFFDEAIKKDQAAHVLFFQSKPACLTGPVLRDKNKKFKETLSLRGWRAFKKHEHLFPHPNFIFSENMYDDGNFKVLDIYMINKKSLNRCVTENLSIFKETLGQEFSIEELISKLEDGCSIISLLNKDERLKGILLGYGEESSHAFKEVLSKCTKTFAPPPTDSYRRIDLKQPKGCKINPVVFMGNPHSSQVKELISIYEKELEEISHIYKRRKDLLKMTLEKLCEE